MNEQYYDKNGLFTRRVKSNLRAFLRTVGYDIDKYGSFVRNHTMRKLCDELEKKAMRENNSYILKKPDNKLKKILSDETDSIDPYFINEICELYGFPIDKIFQFYPEITPETAAEIMEENAEERKLSSKRFAPLSYISHRSYFGEFFGYTVDHNPNGDGDIIDFTLTVSLDENNTPKAEYAFLNKHGVKQIFSGIPYYMPELKTVYIEMTSDNDRRFMYLYFNGVSYNAEKLSYKNGVCVRTSTASKKFEPDVKSFILTGKKLPDGVRDSIVPGLLKMTGKDYYLLSSDLEKALREDSGLERFYTEYKGYFMSKDGAVCLVKEQRMIDSVSSEKVSERIFVFECLTKLKKYALASDRVIYRASEADYNYFYNLENKD